MRSSRTLRSCLVWLLLTGGATLGCTSADEPPPAAATALPPCEILFGAPTASTGLGPDRCQPGCACSGLDWTPPSYPPSDIAKLETWTLLELPAPLTDDPYEQPVPPPPFADAYCGMLPEPAQPGAYRVVSYESEAAAAQAGARVTHRGGCGRCSSLQDLAVYLRYPDLTEPVRSCALEGMSQGKDQNLACLQELGFSPPCADIWYFNSAHTRTLCLAECLAALSEPYHLPDGSLNACLQCDEDQSGPVFKAVAGRTRRNSGLPSALCRPCDTVYPVEHVYE